MAEEQQATQAAAEAQVVEGDEFSALLNKEFRPKSDRAKEEIEDAVGTLAEYALRDTALLTEDAVSSIVQSLRENTR